MEQSARLFAREALARLGRNLAMTTTMRPNSHRARWVFNKQWVNNEKGGIVHLGACVSLVDLERQALLTERATLSSGCSERRRQILSSCLVERDEARDCAWGFGGVR